MVKLQGRMGPKGQVLIPKQLRDITGLGPGSRVLLEVKEGSVVIEKPISDPIKIFEEISKTGKSVKFAPHQAYERELEQRMKRAGLR